MSFSDYLELKVLDHVFRATDYAEPATVYLALYTAAPSDAGGGTEVTGGSYARNAIAFSAAASGAISNSGVETFTDLPAATVTHFGILDASTSGNLLAWGALTSNIVVTAGSEIEFDIGDITISLD